MKWLAYSDDFFIVFILTWFACVCLCAGDTACDKWTAMAQDLTGDGKYHKCVSNKAKVCTRYDCEGSLSNPVHVDYCFGLQLNSCLEPLSMDFYLKLPSFNYSKEFRIAHDQSITLKDLDIPYVDKVGTPLADFEFERDMKGSVLVSVTLRVQTSLPINLDYMQQKVVDEEELPIQQCSKLINATSTQPDKDFMSVQCHAEKYPSQQPKPTQPKYDVKPSKTLNKTCSVSKNLCSEGETCELTSGVNGICACEPDFEYLKEKKACVSRGRMGSTCLSNGHCGVYEECKKDAASGVLFCRCEKSFHWDENRKLCILDKHKSPSHKGHDDTKGGTTTEKPPKEPGDHGTKHKTSSANTKYMIIGGAIAGVVVILVVLVGTFFLCRRSRCNRRFTSGTLQDSDNPLLADMDDDVDLVM